MNIPSSASLTGLVNSWFLVGPSNLMGHGAASEGAGAQLHLLADVAYALLAALWIGELVSFVMLVVSGADAAAQRQLERKPRP